MAATRPECVFGFFLYSRLLPQLQDELAPLAQRRKSKETEISRLKALASEDEERLRSTKESFIGALKELKAIGRQIEEYQSSTAEDELANVERKKAEFAAKTKEKNSQLKALQPQLDRILKAVEDQERHKKNLKENIELINSTQLIEELKKEIAKLEEKAATVEGHETVYDDIESLRARKEEILKAAARLEGRRAEILESVRSIKVSRSLHLYCVFVHLALQNDSVCSVNFLHQSTRKSTRSIA